MAVVLNANDEDRVSAEVIFRVAGVRIMRGPDGALETVRVTVPLNRLRLDTWSVVETVEPAFAVKVRCEALRLKS